MADCRKSLSYASLVGSVLSLLLGVAYVIYAFTYISFKMPGCTYFTCNSMWRTLISFSPDVFMDTFQPMILGGIGILYYFPSRPSWPASMSAPGMTTAWGVFHIIMALFGNLGYIYWVGIAICTFNLLVGTLIIVSRLMMGRNVGPRPKDLDEIPSTTVTAGQPVTV